MKKVLSMLLIFAMILTMASFPAFAAEAVATTITPTDPPEGWDSPLKGTHTSKTTATAIQYAVDGDYTTHFSSNQYNGKGYNIIFELGTPGTLDTLKIEWGGTAWGFMPAEEYTVYVAGDDCEFVEILSYTGLYDPDTAAAAYPGRYEKISGSKGGGRMDVTITETGLNVANVRYIKIRVNKSTYNASIREISATVIPGGSEPEGPVVPTPDFKEDSVETLGAGIRLADGDLTAGIRFGATVSKADAAIEGNYVYSDDANVKFGMYLLPAEKVDVAGGETLKDLVEAGNEDVLDVVAKKIYAQDEETLTYTAVLTGIPETAYTKNIIALPYVKVGDEVIYYETDANSYAGVAQAAFDANEAGTVTLTEDQVKALKEILGIEEEPEGPETPALTEQKVALTTDNITLQDGAWYEDSKTAEYWWRTVQCTSTGTWASTSDYAELVDGNKNVGLYYQQWRETVENGLYVDIIVDLKETKTVSKVSVTTGAGWDEVAYSAPMDSYIFLAGEDGVYGDAVYTYTSNEVVNRRVDEIVFDIPVEDVRYVVYRFTKFQYAATIMEVEVYEMAAGTSGEGGETPESPVEPGVPAEPALITGITVTADGITSAYPDSRPYSIICNGVSGEGKAIAWGDELFISAETYAPGDGSAPLFTLTFDLGAEYDVSRFFVGIGWDTGDITAADLYGSNDGGATWTPVKTGMATGWSAGFDGGDMIGVNLTNASYSMFKLEVMNVSQEANMQIHEIEFTGTRA